MKCVYCGENDATPGWEYCARCEDYRYEHDDVEPEPPYEEPLHLEIRFTVTDEEEKK